MLRYKKLRSHSINLKMHFHFSTYQHHSIAIQSHTQPLHSGSKCSGDYFLWLQIEFFCASLSLALSRSYSFSKCTFHLIFSHIFGWCLLHGYLSFYDIFFPSASQRKRTKKMHQNSFPNVLCSIYAIVHDAITNPNRIYFVILFSIGATDTSGKKKC